jgi:hypothetical protein
LGKQEKIGKKFMEELMTRVEAITHVGSVKTGSLSHSLVNALRSQNRHIYFCKKCKVEVVGDMNCKCGNSLVHVPPGNLPEEQVA